MPPLLDKSLRRRLTLALDYHRRGHADLAERLYRRVLEQHPKQPDALHLLGVLAHEQGRPEAAVELIGQAIEALPNHPAFHSNLGNALHDLGQHGQAAACHERALALAPEMAEAHNNLGRARQAQGELVAAEICYRRACELRPAYATAWLNLGLALAERGRLHEATASLTTAANAAPGLAEAHYRLGTVQCRLGDLAAATRSLERANQCEPGYALPLLELCDIYQQAGRWPDVERCCRLLVKHHPHLAEARTNLGLALKEQAQLTSAQQEHRAALAINPDLAEAHLNLGNTLLELGQPAAALACAEHALALRPHWAQAEYNRALAKLTLGDLAAGWEDYEARGKAMPGMLRQCDAAPWDDGDLSGKTILVHGEQGLGTQTMFASCLPDLIATGAQCVVACDDRLAGLFARSFPQATVMGSSSLDRPTAASRLGPIDCHVPLGGLPRRFRSNWDQFPSRRRFLLADAQQVERWRARLSGLGEGLNVGISWRGGIGALQQAKRGVPLGQWQALAATPGVRLIDVQRGSTRAELALAGSVGEQVVHFDELDAQQDIESLAALLAAVDLVIAVDNSAVHLAGALGAPTWTLLPVGASWRWFTDRADCPWYPTMRLFRQTVAGHWDDVLESVRRELESLLATRGTPTRRAA